MSRGGVVEMLLTGEKKIFEERGLDGRGGFFFTCGKKGGFDSLETLWIFYVFCFLLFLVSFRRAGGFLSACSIADGRSQRKHLLE